jgi:hypothetical protein
LTDGGAGTAWICWGLRDGGTSTSAWDHVVSIGSVTQGVAFSNRVTGLSTNTTYFYRVYAASPSSSDWSDAATMFSGTPASVAGGGGSWSPAGITGLTAWYDASDANTLWADTNGLTNATSAVGRWDDKSGGNYHMLQASSTAQPVIGTRTINSFGTLTFDGSNDRLQTTSNPFGATISNDCRAQCGNSREQQSGLQPFGKRGRWC